MFEEPTTNESGIDIENWDQPIYRIYPKNRFIELLNTKKNVLVRPALWDDPMENFFLNSIVKTEDGELVSLESIAAGWYGQCWTTKEESDAMWRIYSPDKNGVKVRTTINKLFESFYDKTDSYRKLKYFVGKVSYESSQNIEDFLSRVAFTDLALGGQADKFARTLCIKRPEFDHEQEVRLLFHDAQNQHTDKKVVAFNLDHTLVFDQVVIDPRMSENEFNAIKSEIIENGCVSPITQSTLYKISKTIIKM
ncbi:DUF2971 domain-containing protein [uncultured Acinetobacter sp.]|uniref:DUF2971 domain-containing protein n=1 Tax=uncultured Acinetobacter sp. TaxID=165433 RepID=UPI0025841999|nr:DUF2971 domain-containing protein [uncultured Acinetobacter sp.]